MNVLQASQDHCFACGKRLRYTSEQKLCGAITADGQAVFVGWDCWRRINSAGEKGYQPSKGGPRLFPIEMERAS